MTDSHNPTLRERLLEEVSYQRFEQEWIAMKVEEHKPTGDHKKDCGVCQKMGTLNNRFVDTVMSIIADEVVKARIDELKKVQLDYVKYPARIWVDGKPQSIEERISELKKEVL